MKKNFNALIVFYASQGLEVIRLKGGDPLVFGRACEELEAAKEAHIPTAVVAGIASYTVIAAQHQVPLTKRAEHESFWGHKELRHFTRARPPSCKLKAAACCALALAREVEVR